MTAGKNIVSGKNKYYFFEPVYASGINPMKLVQSENITVNTLEDSKLKKIVKVQADLPTMQSYNVTYSLFKNEGRLTCHYSFDKSIEKNKESFHIAFPFDFVHPDIFYGGDSGMLHYNYDQLPGSNKEFVCAEKNIEVRSNSITATLSSPLVCLYEVGNIIDEDETNGVKTWKTTNDTTSPLFLYVFNNYWHTNYKAYQDGHFDFEIELKFRSKK
jgi:hypothetical protein